ncbi:MAG: response regulator [Deltaproteobacteria bacterium]|nr:response regulator [Deltaproteobacteria bacterium]
MTKESKDGQSNIHVLVVDDEEPIRELIQEGVHRCGYKCSVASSGSEALDLMKEIEPEVVITDIMMPGMDGIELSAKIKESYDADVIVITGFVEEYSYNTVMDMGVSDFMEKPVSIHELELRLGRVIRERSNIQKRQKAEAELRESLEKLRVVMESVVEAMALAIEKRDPYTSGHQKRVAMVADAIAKQMALPEGEVNGVRIAAMVHDIGKISVPGEILSKPGSLTDIEMSLIKEHPRIGHDILKGIDFPWPIAEMVIQHHERLDGSGYPKGLTGEKIYLGAKILGVADTVEAMMSHRPYRASLGIDTALDEIRKNKNKLYDPDVVDACVAVFEREELKLD